MLNTTLEEVPDIQNLKINFTRLTNTTVSLQWWSPKFSNSVVRYYHVDYYLDEIFQQQDLNDSFDEPKVINEQHRITVHDTKCHLDHLESYRRYTITITACTTVCSERSLPIKVRTSEGQPGRVSRPNFFYENSTRIAVPWPKPRNPAGPVDYYELIAARHIRPKKPRISYCGFSAPTELSHKQLLDSPNNVLYHSISNVFRVPVPDCRKEQDKGQQTFSFAVRAVNNNPLDPMRPYYGQWSVPESVSCVFQAPDIENLIINVTELTNTTVSLQWSPPKFTNGIVRYYHIDYYLDDIILQQHDLNDTYFDEQQVIYKQRRLTVHDTKVSVVICTYYI
ncbi:uncharacterized protein LOC100575348 isoform X2 [Acyrthosiphon pisum]|uniref:Fibronectin type-III domain-containing protein n=1 Tax=Acyrthosiphon pisum TaxID=7029 RepID=A0A8R2D5D1_ACYPI|nr:uncharacterized protein LOC100575348 isoform X2 [Acyrthosiphon pisum]|eukprot:XP_016661394.1 PREDICTED: uncharacterized protein LOC100575348 isoform X2 [Acyrthosiphon pisum]